MKDTPQSMLKLVSEKLCELYELPDDIEVSLIKYSENIIYKITSKSIEPLVFRLHRPGYHSDAQLESELIWTDEINRDTDIATPVLYKGKNGKYLQLLRSPISQIEYRCDLMSFLYGNAVGELSGSQLFGKMEEIGTITAKLHKQAINRDKSVRLDRMSWDIPEFFGENGVWGSWRNYREVTGEDVSLFEQAQKLICQRLEAYGRTNETFGIIHADLHFFNIIDDGGKMQLIDFDDCGYGFYLYDLGCTLVTYSQDLEKLADCWAKGYEKERKLSEKDRAMLMVFVLLRRIMRLAWLSTHADSDTAKTVSPQYYKVTKEMAEKLINGQL